MFYLRTWTAICEPACKNNGQCERWGTEIEETECVCSKGYSGTMCEITSCENDPCGPAGKNDHWRILNIWQKKLFFFKY